MTGTINPALFGMPDATTTGPQAGVTLTPYKGPMTITTAGAVIENVTINGQLTIAAPNVTIKNCVIQAGGDSNCIYSDQTPITVQNCKLIGGDLTDNGILGNGTFTGNDISHVRIGIQCTSGSSTIRDNYIHDQFMNISDPHYDGVTVLGGQNHMVIEHNTIYAPADHGTAEILIQNVFGPVDDVQINNNLLLGTPSYAVYFEDKTGTPNLTNIAFTNNYVQRGAAGYYEIVHANPTMSGNVEWNNNTDPTPYPTSLPSSPAPTAPSATTIASFSDDTGKAGDGVTNDSTVELKGTAAAGSTVKIYDGSTQIGSTTATSTGSWDYITKVLTDAKHTLTATATNSSGQTSVASSALAITVDTKAPSAPTIASHTVNSANQVVLSGTAEASSVVKVFDGTTQIGTATVNSNGAWGYTSGALAAGSHSLTAKATDAAGNTGAASSAFAASTGTSTAPTAPTSPTAGTVIESAGATRLVESGDKYYLNSSTGTGPSLQSHGVDFVDGSDGTWAPIGAEKTATGYEVVWKEASTGQYTAWNTDSNGNYVSHVSSLTGSTSGGSVSGTNSGLKSLETTFHQDLNGDGQIGATSSTTPTSPTPTAGTVIESAGATRLVESSDKYYLNSSTGTGPSLKYHGLDFVDGSDGTWAPIAAEKVATGYQVVWKEASTGQYTAWNTDNNGNYVSHVSSLTGSTSGGTVSGTNTGLKSLETSFHQDLNGDGQVGTSSVATSSTSTTSLAATSSSTSSNVQTSTSGNDAFVGTTKADTFSFAANFGNDVIKDFTVSGPAHDTIQFSKSVFDSFASVLSHATQSGQDVVIATGGDTLTLKNMKVGSLTSHDFHFA
ncbi:Ig-like domain-containing protein [Bradyrhizobium sp. GCM10028915]|uniref:Ig-like domain-containing protein n=1 Tax=Bradyrhizobium sp. GCM10028915 TaxID=3273385 RepID=UPI0036227345